MRVLTEEEIVEFRQLLEAYPNEERELSRIALERIVDSLRYFAQVSANLVIVESPYTGDVETNLRYARACLNDCFGRGEFPIASHVLYTQSGILDDTDPEERKLGISAGLAWGTFAALTAVYTDRGISPGMQRGIDAAAELGRAVEYRSLSWWER